MCTGVKDWVVVAAAARWRGAWANGPGLTRGDTLIYFRDNNAPSRSLENKIHARNTPRGSNFFTPMRFLSFLLSLSLFSSFFLLYFTHSVAARSLTPLYNDPRAETNVNAEKKASIITLQLAAETMGKAILSHKLKQCIWIVNAEWSVREKNYF